MDFRAYLFFGGNCRDAFSRYQEIFGGELTVLSMADAPSDTRCRRSRPISSSMPP